MCRYAYPVWERRIVWRWLHELAMRNQLHRIHHDLDDLEHQEGWARWDVTDEHWLYLWDTHTDTAVTPAIAGRAGPSSWTTTSRSLNSGSCGMTRT